METTVAWRFVFSDEIKIKAISKLNLLSTMLGNGALGYAFCALYR